MVVSLFNGWYFFYICLALIWCSALFFILRNKSKKVKYNVLLILCFINLSLHFAKLLFSPYREDFPYSIRKITFENICAISTLLLPWIYLFHKNEIIKSYFFFISFIGGLAALCYPTEAFNQNPFVFDVMRFYFCHTMLFSIPLLTSLLNLYHPDYRKCLWIGPMFLLIEIWIFANEIILKEIGFVKSTWEDFFSSDTRNTSMVFGPTPGFEKVVSIFNVFIPSFFRNNFLQVPCRGDFYFPVIWMSIPILLFMPLFYLVTMLPFYWNNIKQQRHSLRGN